MKIEAPKRANNKVSPDAYFIGLSLVLLAIVNDRGSSPETKGEFFDAIMEELQRVGGFQFGETNE